MTAKNRDTDHPQRVGLPPSEIFDIPYLFFFCVCASVCPVVGTARVVRYCTFGEI